MSEFVVTLSDAANHQAAIKDCFEGESLKIYGSRGDERYWLITDHHDRELGTLPRRGNLINAVLAGEKMISAEVERVSEPNDKRPHSTLLVRITFYGENVLQAYQVGRQVLQAEAVSECEVYRVGVAGASNYQPAIRQCAAGDAAILTHELSNPFDDRAVMVTARGTQIGYLPRDGWATEALIDEGKRLYAQIESIESGGNGMLGVVLIVSVGGVAHL